MLFIKELVKDRLDAEGKTTAELCPNGRANKVSRRTAQRMLRTGEGTPSNVVWLLKEAGFGPDEYPSLIRPELTPRRREMGFIKLQMLESLFFAGQIARVREEAKKIRDSGENANQADYFDAEIAKWVGDFAKAKLLFTRLTRCDDERLRQLATAGLIRIADQQGKFDDATTKALLNTLDIERTPKDKVKNPFAFMVAAMRAWASQRNASLPTALRGLKKAMELASRGSSRIEPVQRRIERASMLRKRFCDPDESPKTKPSQAEAAYIEAYASAFACNSMVYMASALNGLARITEHEATIAEIESNTQIRDDKLSESERLLNVAVNLAETSEHAGIIAITVGCMAIVKRRQGNFKEAIKLSKQSIALEHKMGRDREAEVDRLNIELATKEDRKAVKRT